VTLRKSQRSKPAWSGVIDLFAIKRVLDARALRDTRHELRGSAQGAAALLAEAGQRPSGRKFDAPPA
jgi:hypothetical protein